MVVSMRSDMMSSMGGISVQGYTGYCIKGTLRAVATTPQVMTNSSPLIQVFTKWILESLVWIARFEKNSLINAVWGGCTTSRRDNQPQLSKFLRISGFISSRITFLSTQTDLKMFNFSLASWLDLNWNLVLSKLKEEEEVVFFFALVFLAMT